MALGYQNPFYLKQAQKKQQSLYNGRVLLEKHDPHVVYDTEETLQLAQESRLKMKQLNKEIKLANYAKINKLSEVFVSQMAKSREEVYFSNTSKTSSVFNTVFKPILIPGDDNAFFSSVARKFLNEQFLKEAAKFDFKCLANEADESLGMNKVLEYENERLLRAVISQDIMPIVQNRSVVDTSNLKTELDRTKEKLETCIFKRKKNMLFFEMIGKKIGDTSANTKFAKPSILGKPPLQPFRNQSVVRQPTTFKSERLKFPKTQFIPKVVEKNNLIKPVTSHSVPKIQESNVVKYDKAIAPRMFRINPLKNSRLDNFVPNKHVKASVWTKPIIVSQPHVITKKDVNSNTQNHTSPACNNIKLAIQNDNSDVICATCKQCLITANHDKCVFKYVNGMDSSKKNQSANVSESENQKKHQENVKKSMKLGSEE
ncbi:hypothetical protein Tco_1229998 [Tanacetum coccineum]